MAAILSARAAVYNALERAAAFKSLLIFRLLVLLVSALGYVAWSGTYGCVYAAAINLQSDIPGLNATATVTLPPRTLWTIAVVHLACFVPLAYCIISRFSSKRQNALKGDDDDATKKQKTFEARLRKLAVDNVLCCLAGVVALSA